MSSAPLFAGLWVLAATATAFLPMRYQMVLGLPLVGAALVLIVWLGLSYNLWIGAAALAAFVSMFRKPLVHLMRSLAGRGGAR